MYSSLALICRSSMTTYDDSNIGSRDEMTCDVFFLSVVFFRSVNRNVTKSVFLDVPESSLVPTHPHRRREPHTTFPGWTSLKSPTPKDELLTSRSLAQRVSSHTLTNQPESSRRTGQSAVHSSHCQTTWNSEPGIPRRRRS